ncbi:MAG: MmcQ/YjbR family DNA-binding protein [Bacteroidetes bacterium]|nr:MmcQ/YjbR family DNA-binding protein [Bacteroidota bacterium]
MTPEKLRAYCLSLPATEESMPFDDNTLVFKVGGKIFALLDLDEETSINLKCETEKIPELQDYFCAVIPGYHMNKKHWITVLLNRDVSDKQLFEWVKNSYFLVISKLGKPLRNGLAH